MSYNENDCYYFVCTAKVQMELLSNRRVFKDNSVIHSSVKARKHAINKLRDIRNKIDELITNLESDEKFFETTDKRKMWFLL